MTVEFNKLNQYGTYNINIGQKALNKAEDEKKKAEVEEVKTEAPAFKGLENETDLLTHNVQNLYGVKISKYTAADKEIADSTNAILASLGYNYKVSANQVASIAAGLKETVLPGMKLVEDGAVAAHIADPNGPFADLFA